LLSLSEKLVPLAERPYGIQPRELHAASLAVDSGTLALCTGLTDEQLSWSPRPGAWSICQNLAHLRATNEVFLPVVDAALEASRRRRLEGEGPFYLNLFGKVMVWRMESRPIFKMQAPKAVQPRPASSPAVELQNFLSSQAAVRQRIEASGGLHLTALRFPSPLMCCFRFNLLEFFSICNAHARRHLRQAGAVREALPQ
jgi:hypothetical protein